MVLPRYLLISSINSPISLSKLYMNNLKLPQISSYFLIALIFLSCQDYDFLFLFVKWSLIKFILRYSFSPEPQSVVLSVPVWCILYLKKPLPFLITFYSSAGFSLPSCKSLIIWSLSGYGNFSSSADLEEEDELLPLFDLFLDYFISIWFLPLDSDLILFLFLMKSSTKSSLASC